MKRLILMAFLLSLATACTNKQPNLYPKFALDQQVEIVGGFYRGHSGKVTDYISGCRDRDTNSVVICYKVTEIVTDTNTNLTTRELFPVNEKDLR